MYANWHSCYQLDRSIECVVDNWPHTLSDHRPILFGRRTPKAMKLCEGVSRPLPGWTLEHNSWAPRVKELHMNLMLKHGSCTSHMDLRGLASWQVSCSKELEQLYQNSPREKRVILELLTDIE